MRVGNKRFGLGLGLGYSLGVRVLSRAVTFVGVIGCCVFALLYWREQGLNAILRDQFKAARGGTVASDVVDENLNVAIDGFKEGRESAELIKQDNSDFDFDPLVKIGNSSVGSRDKSNKGLSRDFAEWSSEQHTKEIESHVDLKPEERQRLVEALRGSFTSDRSPASPERLAKILEDAGLPGQAELYLEGALQQQAAKLQRDIDDQVAILGSRLGLSNEQTNRIRDVLTQVEVELKPLALKQSQKLAEVMMGHFRGAEPQGQKDLANSYQQLSEVEDALIHRREALLRERLPDILNSDQFSKWSGEQAQTSKP